METREPQILPEKHMACVSVCTSLVGKVHIRINKLSHKLYPTYYMMHMSSDNEYYKILCILYLDSKSRTGLRSEKTRSL